MSATRSAALRGRGAMKSMCGFVQAGEVFFLHMIVMDAEAGLAMCPGHSVLVTATGVERLSRQPLEIPVR